MFGSEIVEKLPNALTLENYAFKKEKREDIRRKINCNNLTVIGHIGRFTKQKNHDYLLKIFSEYLKINDGGILVLVGEGELQGEIRKKAELLNISEKIIFAGVRRDIPELMMAMDILVFPSFYEGMPNVVIEAQAAGLPCLISDKITKEVKLTDLVEFKSLKDQPSEWSDKINEMLERNFIRSEDHKFPKTEYDIEKTMEKFVELILENDKRHNR